MSDPIDRAQAREQEMRDDALAEQARRGSAWWPEDEGETLLCARCDEFIPDGRRTALPGVKTCIECQTDIERGMV